MFQSYTEAIRWITGLRTFGIRPGLDRMHLLMEKLGHPHRRLKFIHVAGTNGKGSTCAFLNEMLLQSGYDVGMFTSPYIEKYTDRIQYNGKPMPEEALLRLVNQLKPIVDEIAVTELGSPSMFEISTTLAIMYFATETYPDYVVWETGLGGRLDCTNIVHPVISVITNVGHDHMNVLGEDLRSIALEKAGIIKPGVPVVSAAEQPEVVEVLKQEAENKKATMYLLDRDFSYAPLPSEEGEQRFDFSGTFRSLSDLRISLNGPHQLTNAATALMTLEVLRQYMALVAEDEDLLDGMYKAKWPGRLETVSLAPRIVLDGAHNPEGAASLARALKESYKYAKLHVMIGMLETKNHQGYFKHILPLVDTLIITEPDIEARLASDKLADIVSSMLPALDQHIEVFVEPEWKTALQRLRLMTGEQDLAIVTGTLYLVADVRSWILHHSDSEKGW